MKQRTRITTLTLTGALALTLSACGGDEEPEASAPAQTGSTDEAAAETDAPETDEETEEPAEETSETEAGGEADGVPPLADIWPTVIENANSAESMTATIVGQGEGMTIDATLTGQLDDSNFQVDATIDGAEVSIIADGDVYYINGAAEFWEMSGAPNAEVFGDQWIEAPEGMGLGEAFSLSSLWNDFFSEVPSDTSDLQTSSAELSEVDGVEAYHYVIDGEDAEIWISADGDDNLLKVIIGEGMEEDLELTVTDWNEAPTVEAPADAVPVEELMGG